MKSNTLYKSYRTMFLTLPQEEIVSVERQHGLLPVFSLILRFVIGAGLTMVLFIIFSLQIISLNWFIIGFVATLLIFILLTVKNIMQWYFHMYVLTTKKITLTYYLFPFSHKVQHIALKEITSIEISDTEGIRGEILDIGHVSLTFGKRSTQTVTLYNIKNPVDFGWKLKSLFAKGGGVEKQIWYRIKNDAAFGKSIILGQGAYKGYA